MFLDDENMAGYALLISDSESNIETTRDLLTYIGFEVHVVDSPAEAVRYCLTRNPCFVIADIEMVGGTGFEAISMVRKLNKKTRVIAATRGDHNEIWPEVGTVCGANSYVVGPLTVEKLVDHLSSL